MKTRILAMLLAVFLAMSLAGPALALGDEASSVEEAYAEGNAPGDEEESAGNNADQPDEPEAEPVEEPAAESVDPIAEEPPAEDVPTPAEDSPAEPSEPTEASDNAGDVSDTGADGLTPQAQTRGALLGMAQITTWADLQAAFNAGGTVTLTQDITATSEDSALVVPSGVTVTLNLNGCTIDRNLTAPAGGGSVIENKGTLTINGPGKITGGFNPGQGGGIYMADSSRAVLTLNGVTITGNTAAPANYSSGNFQGGGVYVGLTNSFTMNGGEIIGNTSSAEGGGVYVLNTSVFTVSGEAVITNNDKKSTSDNTVPTTQRNNLYLASGAVIRIDSPFTGSIGVRMKKNGVFTSGLNGGDISCFFSNKEGWGVGLVDGEGKILELFNISIPDSTEGGTVTANREEAVAGQTVSLTVTPDEGKCVEFVKVNGEELQPVDPVTGLYSFTMPAEKATITAAFRKPRVTTQVLTRGYLKADKTEALPGETVTLTVEPPESGCRSTVVRVDGEELAPVSGVYSFVMPDHDVAVTAVFEVTPVYGSYPSRFVIDPGLQHGSVASSSFSGTDYTVDRGQTIYLTATPEPGYQFGGWSIVSIDANGEPDGRYYIAVLDNNFYAEMYSAEGLVFRISAVFTAPPITSWAALQTAITNAADSDTVVLTQDLTGSGKMLSFPTGKRVTLNLNGHTLNQNRTSAHADGHVIYVPAGATATVKNGTLTGGYANNGGGVNNKGTLTLENVTITGNQVGTGNVTNSNRGGGIYNSGELRITGGAISNNSGNDAGGIYNDTSGTITLTDVTITENRSVNHGGGGIVNYGTAALTNCRITGNIAASAGGGIWSAGTLNISGGAVSENQSQNGNGGGIYVSKGTLSLNGATISGNEALDGGGVFICSGTTVTSTGITYITGNTSTTYGGGGINNAGTLRVSGAFTVTGNSAKGNGGGIWDNGTFEAEGTLIIKDNQRGEDSDDLYLKKGKVITMTGTLTADSSIHISGEVFPTVVASGCPAGQNLDVFRFDCNLTPALLNGEVGMSASYVKRTWDAEKKEVVSEEATATEVLRAFTPAGITAGNHWYVVYEDTTLSDRISVPAGYTVNLILMDGVTLTCPKGVNVSGVFNIYGQAGDTGSLIATGEDYQAGIGGNEDYEHGNINIYGGTIEATGGYFGAGIGTGYDVGNGENNAQVNIYGGIVTATGGEDSAGIGGGCKSGSGKIHIYGGTVTATDGTYAAAIGSGYKAVCREVIIDGGTVTATGSRASSTGIGSGMEYMDCGTITINGGTVIAEGRGGAGIGSGDATRMFTSSSSVATGTITISGGTVEARGYGGGAGIGAGDTGHSNHTITITGGDVTAMASDGGGAAGIGGGESDKYGGDFDGTITISGGTVRATGGGKTEEILGGLHAGGAGLGAGCSGNMNGTITISGGTVWATGRNGGAAIGGGSEISTDIGGECAGTVKITGGTVHLLIDTEKTVPIGHGYKDSKNGTLELGANMTVMRSTSSDGYPVVAANRVSTCQDENMQNITLTIAECAYHKDPKAVTYTRNDSTHTIHCKYCAATPTEAHSFDKYTHTCVCGQYNGQEKWTVKFYAEEGTGTMLPVQVEHNMAWALPEPGFTAPAGMRFRDWRITGGYYVNEHKAPGEEITVTDDTSVFAEWEALPYLAGTVTIESDDGCEVTVYTDDSAEEGGAISSGDILPGGTVLHVNARAKNGYSLTVIPEDSYTVDGDLTITAASEINTYTVTATATPTEGGADPTVSAANPVPYGTRVTVTAGDANEGYEFTGWYQPNGKRLTEETRYTVLVYSNLTLEARYQEKAGTVTFMSNDNVQKTLTATSITQNDFPADPTPWYGFVFTGWDKTVGDINALLSQGKNVTVTAKFAAEQKAITVRIYNGESDIAETVELSKSQYYTVTAEDVPGKTFAYWIQDETVKSYRRTSAFRVAADSVLRAVYTTDAVEAKGTATITKASYNHETGKLSFVAYLAPPDGTKIKAAGLVAISDIHFTPDMELNTDNAQYVKVSARAVGTRIPWTYTWTKSAVSLGDTWYVRPYISYEYDDGREEIVYGDLVTVRAGYDYDSSERATAVIRSASYNAETRKASFVAYLAVPEDGIIQKAGLVAAPGVTFNATENILTWDTARYQKASAKAVWTSIPWTYTWTKTSVNPGDVWYVRAYVIYTDANGAEHTVYGDLFQYTAGN